MRAPRAGFISDVDGDGLMALAEREDVLVEQCAGLGEFALTGTVVARIWGRTDSADRVPEEATGCFMFSDERSVTVDVAFPIRQLADVALRALSPSLNDPTTAENALDSMAELLVRAARAPLPEAVRVGQDGTPRLIAVVPSLDDLVRVGFEQVRVSTATQPALARRVLWLLAEIASVAREHGVSTAEIRRQAELLSQASDGQVPTREDTRSVRDRFAQLERR